jgi:hypothetical protein
MDKSPGAVIQTAAGALIFSHGLGSTAGRLSR